MPAEPASDPNPPAVAALVSGGADSAVMVVDLLESSTRVFPIYVRFGLRWEAAELAGLRAFLAAVARPGLRPLTVLDEPVADVYAPHWSLEGGPEVPEADAPDESVYLPGRNLLLAAKAAVWCRLRGVTSLALGGLASNPFADNTADFFDGLERVLDLALGGPIRLIRPYEGRSKVEVLCRGRELRLPLDLTVSCLRPDQAGHPCGRCNKCAERSRAFAALARLDHPPEPPRVPSPRPRVPCTE